MRFWLKLPTILIFIVECAWGFQQDSQKIEFPVQVLNQAGTPVTGLQAKDFSLWISGKRAQLIEAQEVQCAEFNFGRQKRRPLFILDASMRRGSLLQQQVLQFLYFAAQNQWPVTLILAEKDRLNVVHELATPPPVLLEALYLANQKKRLWKNAAISKPPDLSAQEKAAAENEAARILDYMLGKPNSAFNIPGIYAQLQALDSVANLLRKASGRKMLLFLSSQFTLTLEEPDNTVWFMGSDAGGALPTVYQLAIDDLNASHISVSGLLPFVLGSHSDLDWGDHVGMTTFTAMTGGTEYRWTEPVLPIAQKIVSGCAPYYVLTYERPFTRSGLLWRSYKVEVDRPRTSIRKPQGTFEIPKPNKK
jgi:VWFA-related protein